MTLKRTVAYWQLVNKLEQGRNKVLQMAAMGEPLTKTLNTLCEMGAVYNPDMRCSILRLDEAKGTLHPLASHALSENYCNALDGVEIGPGVGSCGTAAFTKQRVIVEDINTHPFWMQYKELALQENLQACWSEPIKGSNERIYGTFAIYYSEPKHPSEEDLHFIEVSASLASVVLQNYENKAQLIEANEKLASSLDERTKQLEQLNQELLGSIQQQQDSFINNVLVEKMQTTKSLVVGVAHEISTPIGNAILSTDSAQQNIQQLLHNIQSNNNLSKKSTLQCLMEANQALTLSQSSLNKVSNLLQHFKKINTELNSHGSKTFNLTSYFDELKQSLLTVLSGIQLDIDTVDLTICLADESLTQVLVHLIENSITHGFVGIEQGMINITAAVDKDLLIINYHDNGVGIDEAIKDKIFEPFYVNDRSNKSVGLGLSIVNNIVRQSLNGEIHLKKSPANAGARFEIRIPL